jgi:hypothetical protein
LLGHGGDVRQVDNPVVDERRITCRASGGVVLAKRIDANITDEQVIVAVEQKGGRPVKALAVDEGRVDHRSARSVELLHDVVAGGGGEQVTEARLRGRIPAIAAPATAHTNSDDGSGTAGMKSRLSALASPGMKFGLTIAPVVASYSRTAPAPLP